MIQGLYEVHFQVNDLEKSIRFYKKLGLSLAWKNDHVAFLWIELNAKKAGWDSGKNPSEIMCLPSISHFAFGLRTCPKPSAG